MSQSDWGYVSGMVSAQWDRVMDQRALLSLLDATSEEDRRTRLRASLLFADAAPGDRPIDEVQPRFEMIVQRLATLSPNTAFADAFLLGRDWEEFRAYAKVLLLREKNVSTALHGERPEDHDHRFAACFKGLPEEAHLAPFFRAARTILSGMPEGRNRAGWIDLVADAYEAASLRESAGSLESESLSEWVRIWAELRVGLSLLRARQLGWDMTKTLAVWQEAGFDDSAFERIAVGDDAEITPALNALGLPFADDLPEGTEAALVLGRRIDDRITELSSNSSSIPFGPERVFAFLWMLRLEAMNLRRVLSAAAYDIPPERVAAELRTVTHV